MKIFKIKEILDELEFCIKNKLPFSHIRFGDGGIKFIHAILTYDKEQIDVICKKEGIPYSKIVEVFQLWGYYARRANFIDSPEVYFSGEFWDRMRKPGKALTQETYDRMIMWKELYSRSEFDNSRYCNPESNYLMILNLGNKTILDLMKDRKICLITAKPGVLVNLRQYDIEVITIVPQYKNHYKSSFKNTVDKIINTANDYDFWLVAAGELGRIYTGMIKEHGGRAVDIGFVIEYWMGDQLHPRLRLFMEPDPENDLQLILTEKYGIKYKDFI